MNPPTAEADDGNTPLDDDEIEGLIPTHVRSRSELNQWEGLNIAKAYQWLSRRRPADVMNVDFLRTLHRQMFDETWSWAGQFRRTNKNLSPHPPYALPALMHDLLENTRARHTGCDKSGNALEDVAVRFHHELVRIHPWSNGNGRHGRLATDLLLAQFGRPLFSWGAGADLDALGSARERYIRALRAADAGDIASLLVFCRS